MVVVEFPNEDYHRIMLGTHTNLRTEKLDFMFKSFNIFSKIHKNHYSRLGHSIKQRVFKKNENVSLKNTPNNCLMIVKNGSFRLEKRINVEDKNIWPLGRQLWNLSKWKTQLIFS